MESLITSSKDYNRINSRTVSERIFFKWLKEIGAIRFKESTASEYKFFGVTERRYVEESDNQDNSIDLYTKVIKYIGGLDIQGSNLISNKNSTKEAYSYIPSQNGCTPIVLLKTIADENYYPGQVIKKETNVNIEYISGRDSSDQPTPANLDVFAIYDMDVPLSSFNYSVNGGVDPIWFEYLASYGPNCYFTDEVFDDPSNDSIVRTQVTPPDSVTYLRSKLDGISIDFDVANYKDRIKDTDKPNETGAQFVGIDPGAEDALTQMSARVVEGQYLLPTDYDQILLGSQLLKTYLPVDNPGFSALENVSVGSKVRVTINGISREMTVKGIVKSKVGEIEQRAYMVDSQFRGLVGRGDYNVSELAIRLKPNADPVAVRDALIRNGVDKVAKVQTYVDAQPKFLLDIKQTFAVLGNMISSIGLAVASITVFIVIFINAITRRKFIGILKGIGISGTAIEISYMIQSLFYAVAGSLIGLVVLYGFLQPFISAHPIDFPFSDGILVAPFTETMFRVGLLIFTTIVAGYIPARMIVRKNTLDSILGRK
jgi:ABC-type lipoprotein release transport system permease subunit